MNKLNLWTVTHYDNKNQEIVSTEFILKSEIINIDILGLIRDRILCHYSCSTINHKIKKESINAEEFKNLNHVLTTLENLRGEKNE
jgi:hypothetical protein